MISNEGKILLGYEVGTGKPVYLRLHHLVITGMTQLSGKTTTLEALIERSGLKAIAFITKRGEIGFQKFQEIIPYFKERSDWQYVESLIEATMRENQRFNRSWIIKICRNTKGKLRQVLNNAEERRDKARKGSLEESVYTNLVEYLKLVLPQIEKIQFSNKIELKEGVNVMDLSEMSLEMRNLVIQSVMEYALDKLNNTIIIIPEAWEYLPQNRSTPVKYYAESFIRKGASIGNYLWVDSQDIAGIDKTPLRQCDNWILGRQKDVREVRRTREEIFKNTPSEQEIMTLKIGHFYACLGNEVHLIYACPSWLHKEVAKEVALGKIPVEDVLQGFLASKEMDKASDKMLYKERFELSERKRRELEQTIEALRKQNEEMRENLDKYHGEVEELKKTLKWNQKILQDREKELAELRPLKKLKDALIEIFPAPMQQKYNKTATTLDLEHVETTINIEDVTPREISMTTEKPTGKLLYCMVQLHQKILLENPKLTPSFSSAELQKEALEHGWNIPNRSLGGTLMVMVREGQLIRDGQNYRLPSKVKINVVNAQ